MTQHGSKNIGYKTKKLKYAGHTGWCTLHRTATISHMMRHGDAPVYYLHVVLLIWNILTHTTKVMSMNKPGRMSDVM